MVIALIAGLRPGTSPPPVRIAMVLLLAITKKVAEAGLVHQRGLLTGLGRQLLLQNWRHPRPQQLDCFHQLRVRQRTGIHLKSDARNSAQRLAVPDDLLRNLVGITNQQRTFWTALRIETGAGDWRPAALPADIGEGAGVAGKEFATYPSECTPTFRRSGECPNRSPVSRYRSTSERKRCVCPPMIATIKGSPSAPARAKDCGVPPTPSYIGNGSWSGRG